MIDYSLLSFGAFLLGALALGGWAVWIARDKPSDYPEKRLTPGE
jgi:hypothetical protein